MSEKKNIIQPLVIMVDEDKIFPISENLIAFPVGEGIAINYKETKEPFAYFTNNEIRLLNNILERLSK